MNFKTIACNLVLPLFLMASCKSNNAKAQSESTVGAPVGEHWGAEPGKARAWAEQTYQKLNETERIGQLFMVAAYSGGENYNEPLITKLVQQHQIGGVIFMQGTPEKQAQLTNTYQEMAQVPLLIGMDAEWGLGMRLTGVRNYPRQMMIGATRDTALMYEIGTASAAQCKRLGVHVNFAPDIDVNNNPGNPVINFRSFGEDKEQVARMGIAYMRGLQDHGILACAKHFPGHGDVATDSHLDLPVIDKTLDQLKATELYPFRRLMDAGVGSVMIAHLDVPAIESEPHIPTTLSYKTISGLLKKDMGFKGLIFTDALNMKGVTKYFPDGETDLRAFLAGNDVLLFSQDVPLAISKIQQAMKEGKVSQQELQERVLKVLEAKYYAGLHRTFSPIDTQNITSDLNASTASIWEKVAAKALTLERDQYGSMEKLQQENAKVAYLNIGKNDQLFPLLQQQMPSIKTITGIETAATYDVVIVSVHASPLYPGKDGNYGLSAAEISQLDKIAGLKNAVVVLFGNAYAAKFLCDVPALLFAYEENEYSAKAAAAVVSGKAKASGVLPVHGCAR